MGGNRTRVQRVGSIDRVGEGESTRFSQHWRYAVLAIFPLYVLITSLTLGLRLEHVIVAVVFVVCAYLPAPWWRLSWRCLPLFMTLALYDNFRYLVDLRGTIHVADLYFAELRWFGLDTEAGRITLPEFFRHRTHPALDLVCGFAYLAYLYEIIILAIYLFFRDEQRAARFAWAYFAVNALGMLGYLIYPAAPPWYVAKYGLGPARLDVAGDPAGASRFDALLGINYFKSFYARSSNVFGAMPSLHVAYPVLACCAVVGMGWRWVAPTGAFALVVAFSAIYLDHHYVWDVSIGTLIAIATHHMVKIAWRAGAARKSRREPSVASAGAVCEKL